MYIKRAMEHVIRDAEKGFKAVLVTGPRQVGKSTILQHIHPERKYISFDDPVLLSETRKEPGLFFRNNKPPVVLDEIQYISQLFSYIKIECDNSEQNGRINLTGSQQYHLMKGVSESLAGRVAILELSGLSLREQIGCEFNQPFIPTQAYIEEREKSFRCQDDLWERIHRGSYPALMKEEVDWQMFFGSYIQTYLSRDVNELGNVKDKQAFTVFMTALAARTGQMLNYTALAEQVGISVATVREWVSLLEASGIIYIMQPYSNSALTRAVKTPKVYFRDTGLVSYLCRYQTAETARNGALAGALFETYVVSEVLKSFSNAGKDYRLYVSYYRGKDKIRKQKNGQKTVKEAEIDLLIEDGDTIYPVEIKMSANPKLDMANAFDVIDRIAGKKRGTGVILCMYGQKLWLSDQVVALPVEFI